MTPPNDKPVPTAADRAKVRALLFDVQVIKDGKGYASELFDAIAAALAQARQAPPALVLPSDLSFLDQMIQENAQLLTDKAHEGFHVEGVKALLYSMCDGACSRYVGEILRLRKERTGV